MANNLKIINTDDTFKVANRGIAFTFYISENKHLIGMDIMNETVSISGDLYKVKEVEEFRGGHHANEVVYGIIVEKC